MNLKMYHYLINLESEYLFQVTEVKERELCERKDVFLLRTVEFCVLSKPYTKLISSYYLVLLRCEQVYCAGIFSVFSTLTLRHLRAFAIFGTWALVFLCQY